MSFAKKYNSENTNKFNIDTKGFEYKSLKELYETNGESCVYSLTCIFINTKSKYGDSVVFGTDKHFVNIPSHMLDVAKDILNNEGSIETINNNKVGFTIYQYECNNYNKTCYSIRFIDIE